MPDKPKTAPTKSASTLKGGEFKRHADEVNKRESSAPSLSEVDWADLPPKAQEKRRPG
jgi:hypothetical protein